MFVFSCFWLLQSCLSFLFSPFLFSSLLSFSSSYYPALSLPSFSSSFSYSIIPFFQHFYQLSPLTIFPSLPLSFNFCSSFTSSESFLLLVLVYSFCLILSSHPLFSLLFIPYNLYCFAILFSFLSFLLSLVLPLFLPLPPLYLKQRVYLRSLL